MAFILFFCKLLEEADCHHEDEGFWLFHRLYSLWTVVIRLHIYFTDWFCGGVLNFEITKTKIPKFTVKFDLELGGKTRTEDNLTD